MTVGPMIASKDLMLEVLENHIFQPINTNCFHTEFQTDTKNIYSHSFHLFIHKLSFSSTVLVDKLGIVVAQLEE